MRNLLYFFKKISIAYASVCVCVCVLKGEGGVHYFLECELSRLLKLLFRGGGGVGWSKPILTAKLGL